jgi:hypothetical protein
MQHRLLQVPMFRCLAACARCEAPSDEYTIAATGGMGGDFRTLQQVRSGALYRQDLTAAQYDPQLGAIELKLIEEHAGGADQLREVPGTLRCKLCGTAYRPVNPSVVAQDKMDVFVVINGTAA